MASIHELLKQIDRLKTMHRAGIQPHAGDVESLFDLAAQVKVEASVPSAPPAGAAAFDRVQLIAEATDAEGRVVRLPLTFAFATDADRRPA